MAVLPAISSGAAFGQAVAVPADDFGGPTRRFDELTDRAMQQRRAQAYAESARSFAAAFEELSEDEQRGPKGTIVVSNAVDDYRRAQVQAPDELALWREEAAVLERFAQVWAQGQPPNGGEPFPVDLVRELARVQAELEELEGAQAASIPKQETGAPVEGVVVAKGARPAGRLAARSPDALRRPTEPTSEASDRLRRHRVGVVVSSAAILSVSLLGGGALVVNGGWTLADVERRSDRLRVEVDGAPGGTMQMRQEVVDEIEQWQRKWRGIGAGLVVAGVLLSAGGVGWAVWRIRSGLVKSRRSVAASPLASRRGLGLRVRMVF